MDYYDYKRFLLSVELVLRAKWNRFNCTVSNRICFILGTIKKISCIFAYFKDNNKPWSWVILCYKYSDVVNQPYSHFIKFFLNRYYYVFVFFILYFNIIVTRFYQLWTIKQAEQKLYYYRHQKPSVDMICPW